MGDDTPDPPEPNRIPAAAAARVSQVRSSLHLRPQSSTRGVTSTSSSSSGEASGARHPGRSNDSIDSSIRWNRYCVPFSPPFALRELLHLAEGGGFGGREDGELAAASRRVGGAGNRHGVEVGAEEIADHSACSAAWASALTATAPWKPKSGEGVHFASSVAAVFATALATRPSGRRTDRPVRSRPAGPRLWRRASGSRGCPSTARAPRSRRRARAAGGIFADPGSAAGRRPWWQRRKPRRRRRRKTRGASELTVFWRNSRAHLQSKMRAGASRTWTVQGQRWDSNPVRDRVRLRRRKSSLPLFCPARRRYGAGTRSTSEGGPMLEKLFPPFLGRSSGT